MNINNPLVSVIVPAYNAEETIRRCIESLINQTIPIEIIIVDDGSRDGTALICREYEEGNSNIHLVTQSNKGVSAARNVGLKTATGKYIGFVDSDDYVRDDMFEKLSQSMEADDNIAISIVRQNSPKNDGLKDKLSYREVVKDILCSSSVRGYPWNKLFRKQVIDDAKLLFNTSIHVMEDKLFCLQYMNAVYAGEGIELNDKLYYYCDHDGEYTLNRYSLERYKTGLDACDEILKLSCISKDEELTKIQEAITVKHCIQIARECIRLNESVTPYQLKAKMYRRVIPFSRYLTMKQKVGYIVLQLCPFLLKNI